jgi:hypothetical protein
LASRMVVTLLLLYLFWRIFLAPEDGPYEDDGL